MTCETFYEPRGPVARLANALLMRRRFASVRREMLQGLKELVETPPSRSDPARAEVPA